MTTQEVQEVSKLLRTIEDFPEKGVIFRDITTVLKDKKGLQIVIKDFTERLRIILVRDLFQLENLVNYRLKL